MTGRPTPSVAVGFVLAAVVAAVASAYLRYALRPPQSSAPRRPALLIGTADAVLIGLPLALMWFDLVA
jgi:hypothetical protein